MYVSRGPFRPKWYALVMFAGVRLTDGCRLGMAVVPSPAELDQLCDRDRIQGLRLLFARRMWTLTCTQVSGASSHLFGDGMAIWLTTDRAEPGPVFGSKGPSCLYMNSLVLTSACRQV